MLGNDFETEWKLMKDRLDHFEKRLVASESKVSEPAKHEADLKVEKRFARIEQDLTTAHSRMENSVYKSVTDMLRD